MDDNNLNTLTTTEIKTQHENQLEQYQPLEESIESLNALRLLGVMNTIKDSIVNQKKKTIISDKIQTLKTNIMNSEISHDRKERFEVIIRNINMSSLENNTEEYIKNVNILNTFCNRPKIKAIIGTTKLVEEINPICKSSEELEKNDFPMDLLEEETFKVIYTMLNNDKENYIENIIKTNIKFIDKEILRNEESLRQKKLYRIYKPLRNVLDVINPNANDKFLELENFCTQLDRVIDKHKNSSKLPNSELLDLIYRFQKTQDSSKKIMNDIDNLLDIERDKSSKLEIAGNIRRFLNATEQRLKDKKGLLNKSEAEAIINMLDLLIPDTRKNQESSIEQENKRSKFIILDLGQESSIEQENKRRKFIKENIPDLKNLTMLEKVLKSLLEKVNKLGLKFQKERLQDLIHRKEVYHRNEVYHKANKIRKTLRKKNPITARRPSKTVVNPDLAVDDPSLLQ